MWVVKLSNGRGHVEWYQSLSVRAQSRDKDEARKYADKAEAEERARFCERHADAFSGIFHDGSRYTLVAEVEEYHEAHVSVWLFRDAPEAYRKFCPPARLDTGGDHESVEPSWLAYVPPGFGWVGWLDSREFTCCKVFEQTLENGAQVIIGAHHRWCEGAAETDLPVDSKRVIRVWQYGDKRIDLPVPRTDDADWVAQVPKELVDTPIAWMESGTSFGCCGVDVHQQPDGSEVRIGCHA